MLIFSPPAEIAQPQLLTLQCHNDSYAYKSLYRIEPKEQCNKQFTTVTYASKNLRYFGHCMFLKMLFYLITNVSYNCKLFTYWSDALSCKNYYKHNSICGAVSWAVVAGH
jgi:hypothetical protein